jgi:hypothetical protein
LDAGIKIKEKGSCWLGTGCAVEANGSAVNDQFPGAVEDLVALECLVCRDVALAVDVATPVAEQRSGDERGKGGNRQEQRTKHGETALLPSGFAAKVSSRGYAVSGFGALQPNLSAGLLLLNFLETPLRGEGQAEGRSG